MADLDDTDISFNPSDLEESIVMPKPPMTLTEAIAREEGYYVPNSRARRNNNPGNIEYGVFTRIYGATHGDPRFAIFPTPESGWTALTMLLAHHYGGRTIYDAIRNYAPSSENDTDSYIRNICAWCECSPTSIITPATTNFNEVPNAGDSSPQSPPCTATL